MLWLHIQNSDFKNQIEYAFMNIFFMAGLEFKVLSHIEDERLKHDDIIIDYGYRVSDFQQSGCRNVIFIKQCGRLFGKNYMDILSIPENVRHYNGHLSIFSEDCELYINEDYTAGIIETNMDIVSDIFFMLTRYEEVINFEASRKERFNRFPAAESFAFKNGFLHRPVVNEHADLLWSFIERFNLGYKKKKWWGDKKFAACLTHDVDDVLKYNTIGVLLRSSAGLFIKHKKPIAAIKILAGRSGGYRRDPYYTFDYIIDLEKSYNFKSSFYFMTGGSSEFDNFYNVHDAKVVKLIQKIENEGFEAGYHGSFNSYSHEEALVTEKKELDSIIKEMPYGCRQHFLRFSAPSTWRIQSKAGFLYDTTLGFADAEGFRCGTCFPFKPYDIVENRLLEIWEIPLIVMEQTLKGKDYRAYTPEQGMDVSKKLISTVKKHNGVFVLLYHNTSFDCTDELLDGWTEAYEETMRCLYENDCLATSGREIIKLITE
ncbi:MAG: polysaccharide deacetylase family protein [Sedimentibacter sp.]|uniref:polysaccharide deacetylase family protein n=1 Tax=Sedimentibacter sp. TaxID=1960295 RepID=UPI003158FB98